MNIQQLIDQTLAMEEFELEAAIFEPDGTYWGMDYTNLKLIVFLI